MKRLQEGVGDEIRCDTLRKTIWLLDVGFRKLDSKSVVILDEAGMVGTKQLAQLVKHVKNAPGARLILVGDAKQLQPIDAGGPFKFLARPDVLGEIKLVNIRRQEEVWARDAVH